MNIDELIAQIRTTPDCEVYIPTGLPTIDEEHILPDDLRTFYELCGGVSLFQSDPYPLMIVPPARLVLANPVIIGELAEYDRSSAWYIIGDDGNSDYLTIDLSSERLGRCYDSFHETHGVAGSCPIIATSFTDLLTRLYENKGQRWYWLRPDFVSLGDAYDDV